MREKILKPQLLILSIFALINVIYFYFGQSFPDNSFEITHNSVSINFISYYLSTIFAQVHYYLGPWIFLPCITAIAVYFLILSKRDERNDYFLPTIISLFYFGVVFLFAPSFLGEGILHIVENVMPQWFVAISTLIFSFLIFFMVFRGSFIPTCKKIYQAIRTTTIQIFKLSILLKNTSVDGFSKLRAKTKGRSIRIKASALIKDGAVNTIDENVEEEVLTPRVVVEERNNDVPEAAVQLSNNDDLVSSELVPQISAAEVQKAEKRTSIKAASFFKTNDLIDCITKEDSHFSTKGPNQDYFAEIIESIENKIAEFKVTAKVINILKGPVVDTFELELGDGVRASKISGLADDIGLALRGVPVRIVYPMLGRKTVGIEVPRNPREIIYLDEVLKTEAFKNAKHRLPIAMGKDSFGETTIVDLAGMPHMLVAGATGAGKSVFINTLLVSLVIKKSPRDLKLILIDPKQLELALYQELPHLMLPVITTPSETSTALLWAVQEMERRYSILKEMGVKNIEGFNKKIKSSSAESLAKLNQFYEETEDEGYELPYLVIVVDEYADLILSKAGKEIEVSISRLAAKARAAGIHLVVATQRPSTKVITGVIKSNFPTRISFRVTTGIDSRVVLDQQGAEKLLGKGDMLYKHGVDIRRLHSAFVDETEIEVLVDKLSKYKATFNASAMEFIENGGGDAATNHGDVKVSYGALSTGDPQYDEAVQVVMEQGSASASMLQRRLRVGYNRAANLIESMEKNGIVGPANGSKPRDVLVGKE